MTPASKRLTRATSRALVGRGQVAMDDADAAFLREGDREAGFRDRVHGGGNDRKY